MHITFFQGFGNFSRRGSSAPSRSIKTTGILASVIAPDVAAVPHLAVLKPLEYYSNPNVRSLYNLGNVCFFSG